MSIKESETENMLDDVDAWDVPKRSSRKKSERRQRGAMVSVRLTPDELNQLQAAAKERGLTVAAFIRERAVRSTATANFGPSTTIRIENTTGSGTDVVRSEDVNYPRPLQGAN